MGWADEFAEGFATGFVPAYENSVARREKRRDAEFESKLSAWESIREKQQEEAQKARQAQRVASAIGVPASDAVYDAMNIYGSASDVINAYQEGQITFNQTAGSPSGGADANEQTQSALTGGFSRNDVISASEGPTKEAAEAMSSVDDNAVSTSMDFLRQQEGFREEAYYDVDANRVGYGSDTVTRQDGSIIPVSEGTRVTREDAERDLERRISEEFMPSVRDAVGAEAFNRLTTGQKTALTSIAYNYGRNAWDGRLSDIANAVRTGDDEAAARGIMNLSTDNDGINASRRQREAALFSASSRQQPVDQQMEDSGMSSPLLNSENVTAPEQRNAIGSLFGAYDNADSRFSNYLDETGQRQAFDQYQAGETNRLPDSGMTLSIRPSSNQVELKDLPNLEMIRDPDRYRAAESQVQAIIAENGESALPRGYLDAFRNHRTVVDQLSNSNTVSDYLADVGNAAEAQVAIRKAEADGASAAVISSLEQTRADLENSAFEAPKTPEEARQRYNAAIRIGDDEERERIAPFLNTGEADIAKFRVVPRDGTPGNVRTLQTRVDPATGQTEYVDLQGNTVTTEEVFVAPLTEDMIEDSNSVNTALAKDIRDYNSQRRAILGLGELGYDMAQIFEANPEAGTRVAGLVSGLRTAGREAATAGNILGTYFSDSDEISEIEATRLLQERGFLEDGETIEQAANRFEITDFVDEDLVDLGAARKALEAKMLLAIFRVGGIEGQSGRSMSDKTFQHFQNFIKAARTPERFRRNIGDYLRNVTSQVNQQESDIVNSPQAQNFIRNYDYNPVEITPMEDVISNNESYSQAFDYFFNSGTPQRTAPPSTGTDSASNTSAAPQPTGRAVTEEMARQNPNLAPFVGQRVRGVRGADGSITIEVVE